MDSLREYLREHELTTGSRLPSERALIQTMQVSRSVINRAILGLISAGVLRREGYKLIVAGQSSMGTSPRPPIHVVHMSRQGQPVHVAREILDAAHDVAERFASHTIPVLCKTPEEQIESLKRLNKQNCAGFIIWPSTNPPVPAEILTQTLSQLQEAGVPLVVCNQDVGNFDSVTTDNAYGVGLMVDHLYQRGHRHMAYFTSPQKISGLTQRLSGYRVACLSVGLTRSAERVVSVDDEAMSESVNAAVAEVLKDSPRPTAILCSNDYIAVEVLRSLTAAHVRVPSEMSVAGFDDDIFSSVVSPPLTTIAQDFYQIGVLAAEALYRRILIAGRSGMFHPVKLRLEPRLVVRKSTMRR